MQKAFNFAGFRDKGDGRSRLAADVHDVSAAWMKSAAGRKSLMSHLIAPEHYALPFLQGIRIEYGRDQSLRVGVTGFDKQPIGRATFDDATQIHDGHLVAHVLHDRKIVGNEDIGEA